MARTRKVRLILVVAGVMVALMGCSGRGTGVSIPPGFDDLDQCPPRSIAVEDLRAIGEPGCDLVG